MCAAQARAHLALHCIQRRTPTSQEVSRDIAGGAFDALATMQSTMPTRITEPRFARF